MKGKGGCVVCVTQNDNNPECFFLIKMIILKLGRSRAEHKGSCHPLEHQAKNKTVFSSHPVILQGTLLSQVIKPLKTEVRKIRPISPSCFTAGCDIFVSRLMGCHKAGEFASCGYQLCGWRLDQGQQIKAKIYSALIYRKQIIISGQFNASWFQKFFLQAFSRQLGRTSGRNFLRLRTFSEPSCKGNILFLGGLLYKCF